MTLNEVTTQTGSLPASFSDDPYLDYGIEAATAGATFLKFDSRGGQGYSYGVDATPLPLGTRLAANMAGVRVGWLKWVNGKPEKVLSLISERRRIGRDELGDHDAALWENPAEDPWREAAELELVNSIGQQFIFSTNSGGGTKGVKKLCYDFARERRSRPGQVPLVELGQHWYPHPKFSKVWEPDFGIVDWVDETTLTPASNGAEAEIAPAAEASRSDATQENTVEAAPEKPVETTEKKPVPVLKAKTPRF